MTNDGERFEPICEPGFGDKDNEAVVRMCSVDEFLFIGTWNNRTGGQLRRSTRPHEGRDWELLVQDGFGNPANLAVGSIRPFRDRLYVGMFNPSQGEEMWSSPSGDPGTFVKSFDRGLGVKGATDVSVLYDWNGHLYLGTESAQPPYPGCDVWRTSGLDSDGKESWIQVASLGFGDNKSFNAFRIIEFNGKLYVGTWGFGASSFTTGLGPKGTTVWRRAGRGDGVFDDWEQVNDDGFGDAGHDSTLAMEVLGDTLYVAGFGNHGFLFETKNGSSWRQIEAPGFADSCEFGIHALGTFRGKLYVGMQNWSKPSELWVLDPKTE